MERRRRIIAAIFSMLLMLLLCKTALADDAVHLPSGDAQVEHATMTGTLLSPALALPRTQAVTPLVTQADKEVTRTSLLRLTLIMRASTSAIHGAALEPDHTVWYTAGQHNVFEQNTPDQQIATSLLEGLLGLLVTDGAWTPDDLTFLNENLATPTLIDNAAVPLTIDHTLWYTAGLHGCLNDAATGGEVNHQATFDTTAAVDQLDNGESLTTTRGSMTTTSDHKGLQPLPHLRI